MQRGKILIVPTVLVLLVAQVGFAEVDLSKIPEGYEFTISKSKETDNKLTLRDEDEKLAKAISLASAYARFIGEDDKLTGIDYEVSKIVVKGARGEYIKNKETMDFTKYVVEKLNKHRALCDNYPKYIQIFLDDIYGQ